MRLKQLYLVVFIIGISACTTSQSISNEDLNKIPEIDPGIAAVESDKEKTDESGEDGFIKTTDEYSNKPGVVLTFDDSFYEINPNTWTRHFDLFDRYGAKVTFFVNGRTVTGFMHNAQNRGHEIGFHTVTHPRLSQVSREQFFIETISPIAIYKEAGIELNTFAYPFGIYREWMHDELLNHYKILRGYTERYSDDFRLYTKDEMKTGFIDSISIDNVYYSSETYFRNTVDKMLNSAKNEEKIVVITSHGINNARWGITAERLEYVLQKIQEYGLLFYRFKDF